MITPEQLTEAKNLLGKREPLVRQRQYALDLSAGVLPRTSQGIEITRLRVSLDPMGGEYGGPLSGGAHVNIGIDFKSALHEIANIIVHLLDRQIAEIDHHLARIGVSPPTPEEPGEAPVPISRGRRK